eukprot:12359891-Alexandrium_andersonii.AAC.1
MRSGTINSPLRELFFSVLMWLLGIPCRCRICRQSRPAGAPEASHGGPGGHTRPGKTCEYHRPRHSAYDCYRFLPIIIIIMSVGESTPA